jgi:glyoxylase-like metal-dependent hydrolase (beta-lactamase superfamily II)
MLIADGIHRVEAPLGDRYIAMYLVEGDEGCALIDTALDESIAGTLVPYLKRIGRNGADIRWVVNTHADFDHVGGNRAIRDLCPTANIVCGGPDRAQIEDVEVLIHERYGEFREHGFDESPDAKAFIRSVTKTAPIDGVVEEGQRLELGGRYLEVIGAPGHSDGHVALIDSATGSALIGDAVLWNSVLTANGEPAFPPTYRSVAPYRATIDRLLVLDVPVLLTAHYDVTRGPAAKEFLDGSRSYTNVVERTILEVLGSARSPMGLLEIIAAGSASFGPWTSVAAQYLVYPVLGHLEMLEENNQIDRCADPSPPRWSLRA